MPKVILSVCVFRCFVLAQGGEEQHQYADFEVAWFRVWIRWMWAPGLLLFLPVLLCPVKPLPRPAVRLCARCPAETHVRSSNPAKGWVTCSGTAGFGFLLGIGNFCGRFWTQLREETWGEQQLLLDQMLWVEKNKWTFVHICPPEGCLYASLFFLPLSVGLMKAGTGPSETCCGSRKAVWKTKPKQQCVIVCNQRQCSLSSVFQSSRINADTLPTAEINFWQQNVAKQRAPYSVYDWYC